MIDDKQRKLTIVSEETEDKFKEKFFPALYEFESKVLNSGNYDGEYGLHLYDTLRYQGIADFLMKPFSEENQAKLIFKDKNLFAMIPEVKKVAKKYLSKFPLYEEIKKVFRDREIDSRYADPVLQYLIVNKDFKISLYKDIRYFERMLIRFIFLQFLVEIEKDNAELKEIFLDLSEDYQIERGVFRMNILALFQVLRQRPSKEFSDVAAIKALEELKKAAEEFVRIEQEKPIIISKQTKEVKEDFSHKIRSFTKFKRDINE